MQRAFASEYARNGGNARQAALTAGYSPKTAHSQGSRLLHHPSVQEEVRRQTFAYVDHVAPLAVQALVDVIEDANVRPRDKIKAAEASSSISDLVNDAVKESLAEDLDDLQVFRDREAEPTIEFESFLKKMKKNGRL